MRSRYVMIALILSMICLADLWAALGINLSVDMDTITMEDQITMSVSVNGAKDTASSPNLSKIKGFDTQSVGTSSQVQIINGQVTVQKVFNYILTPQKEGRYSLGPVTIKVKREILTSNTVTITVKKNEDLSEKGIKDKNYFIVAKVSNSTPFVGEQITYSFKFYKKVRIGNANLGLPKFDSFWQEEMGKQKNYTETSEGSRWDVTEVQSALFANSPGKMTIVPATLLMDIYVRDKRRRRTRGSIFDSFLGGMRQRTKRVRLKTESIDLDVLDHPSQDKPAGFSGAVGIYQITSSLSKSSVPVGASTTLTIEIRGEGNIRNVQMPKISLDGFKTYDDKPQVDIYHQNGKVMGRKIFKMALVPQKEGSFTIGPLVIDFLNPDTKQYEQAHGLPITLQITPASAAEDIAHLTVEKKITNKKNIKVLGHDLMPIKRDIRTFSSDRLTFINTLVSLLLILFLPIVFLLIRMFKNRRDLIRGNFGLKRKSIAYKKFSSAHRNIGESELYENASNILRSYLGDKLNIDGTAMTSADIDRKLATSGVSSLLVEDLKDFLRTCEMGVYGGDSGRKDSNTVKNHLKTLVGRCEKEVRR